MGAIFTDFQWDGSNHIKRLVEYNRNDRVEFFGQCFKYDGLNLVMTTSLMGVWASEKFLYSIWTNMFGTA